MKERIARAGERWDYWLRTTNWPLPIVFILWLLTLPFLILAERWHNQIERP